MRLTAVLAVVEPKEKTNDASNNEQETNEVKVCHMFTEGPPLMWVKVQEEEQDKGSNPSSRPADEHEFSGEWTTSCNSQVDEEAPPP